MGDQTEQVAEEQTGPSDRLDREMDGRQVDNQPEDAEMQRAEIELPQRRLR